MYQKACTTLISAILVFVQPCLAQSRADWGAVQRLKWDTPARVELWTGQEYVGRFDLADARILRLKVVNRQETGQTASAINFAREDVRVVATLGRSGRDPEATLHNGAVIGAVGGAIAVGIAARNAWPIGALAGGAAGAMAGTIVGSTVAIAKDAPRRGKIVYESDVRPPVPQPPKPAN
jgi:hypothetical protein